MPDTVHPLVNEARLLVDASADNVRTVAGLFARGSVTLATLLDAVDTFRAADRELDALLALRLVVNGRTYTLRRPATSNVRGEA